MQLTGYETSVLAYLAEYPEDVEMLAKLDGPALNIGKVICYQDTASQEELSVATELKEWAAKRYEESQARATERKRETYKQELILRALVIFIHDDYATDEEEQLLLEWFPKLRTIIERVDN